MGSEIKHLNDLLDGALKEKEEAEIKIEKAIEFIKESCVYDEDDEVGEKVYSIYVPTLLEILGNKENEE